MRESVWATLFTFRYAPAPTNPETITETHSLINNAWQNSVNAPAFTWSGATDGGSGSGVRNYDVYWGTSASGTTVVDTVSAAAYSAPTISDGIYYLRLRTRTNNDLVSAWTTLFTVKYDSTPPSAISNVAESGGTSDNVWQATVSDPAFTWSATPDNLSGVEKYLLYWDTSSSGTGATETTTPAYDPAPVSSGIYYLNGRAIDRAGNATNWQTLYTFKYDPTAPVVQLDAPASYPATLDFAVRWQVTDAESNPANCTVERQTGGLHSYLANNQTYPSVNSARHFENLSGVAVLFTATCHNGAGLASVVTDTTLIAPAVPDADSDEMPDEFETTYGLDPHLTNDAAGDLDSDELTNLQEYQYGTSPVNADTDSDGLSDYDEVNTLWGADLALQAETTDPVDWDTDGDGFGDGWEVARSYDPLNPNDPYDLTVDTDNDGLPDGWETAYGLNPNDGSDGGADGDGDGLTNLEEFNHRANPTRIDTDNDGLDDNAEVTTHQTDPTRWDSDLDGWGDGEEISQGTDPSNGNDSPTLDDSDLDGMKDSWETDNGLNPDTDDATDDPDNDGLTNLEEYAYATDPHAADSDGDGFDDAAEIQAGSDPTNRYSTPDNPAGTVPIYLPVIVK